MIPRYACPPTPALRPARRTAARFEVLPQARRRSALLLEELAPAASTTCERSASKWPSVDGAGRASAHTAEASVCPARQGRARVRGSGGACLSPPAAPPFQRRAAYRAAWRSNACAPLQGPFGEWSCCGVFFFGEGSRPPVTVVVVNWGSLIKVYFPS